MRVFISFLCALFFLFIVSISALGTSDDLKEKNNLHANKDGWPRHLRMIIGANGEQWNMKGDPIAEVLSRRVLPTSSRVGNGLSSIKEVNAKESDLAFILGCFMEAASSEQEKYEGVGFENTVLMANVYPQVLYFLVRKDFAAENGINSVETLLQKKMPLHFGSLRPGTSSEFILSLLLKHGYNTNFKQLAEQQGWHISFNSYSEGADKFVAGELDCFVCIAGVEEPMILEMEKYASIIILPLEQSVLDLLSEKFKTNTHIIQPGVYESVNTPVKTLSDHTCFLVRKDLPEDLVFEITKALWQNKEKISIVVNGFEKLKPETAQGNSSSMHPGAMKFWNSLQAIDSGDDKAKEAETMF